MLAAIQEEVPGTSETSAPPPDETAHRSLIGTGNPAQAAKWTEEQTFQTRVDMNDTMHISDNCKLVYTRRCPSNEDGRELMGAT